jgi:hypothetical protein
MATKSTSMAAELMTLIVERAPALIAAGVTSLAIGDFTVELAAPPAAMPPMPKPKELPTQHIDPMKDSSTYPGGRIPGFTKEDEF